MSYSEIIAVWMVLVLLSQSLLAWGRLILTIQNGQPALEWADEPRANWIGFAEVFAVGLVILMVLMHLIPKFLPDLPEAPAPAPQPLNQLQVIVSLAITGGLAMTLPGILMCSQRPPAEFGFRVNGLITQVRDGVNAYFLALLPTAIMLLLTSPLRSRDSQNPLLTLLTDSPDPVTLLLIGLAAVVMAPLYEEMMFRVILQGWLTSRLGSQLGILITALWFAAIHGPIDGVALLPLAAVLGIVFDRRHSYISVVVIHGLFNATMLTLALLTQTAGDPTSLK